MEAIAREAIRIEAGPTFRDQCYLEDQDVTGGLEVEREEGGMVGVGGSDYKGDAQGTTVAARVAGLSGSIRADHRSRSKDGDLRGMDGRRRLACELLKDSFVQLARLQLKLEAGESKGANLHGKWRFEQDKIIQFLKKETWAHTLSGREPRECYNKALEIVR
jgi:hypothetical protein